MKTISIPKWVTRPQNPRPSQTQTLSDQVCSAPAGPSAATPSKSASLIQFRPYQQEAFANRANGVEVWLWARQVGKSFTLAAWAVDRLVTIPGRTVTILSNSKFNGMELNRKCAEVCRRMGQAFEQADLSPDNRFESMRAETRVTINGQVGRILVLAANPLTVRGFSGDLILDEFAFHEDSAAIWNEAHPILAGHRDYLCRIASTPNGKHNHFYRMATDPKYPLRKVTRTMAHAQGCPVYHEITREEITPAQARELADNKRSYDQNYECAFEDENMALLTHELINAAERPDVGLLCATDWNEQALKALTQSHGGVGPVNGKKTAKQWVAEADDPDAMLRHLALHVCNGSADRFEDLMNSDLEIRLNEAYDQARARREQDDGPCLFAGVDVGRNNDRTVVTVLERLGNLYLVKAILRLEGMRLPEQQRRLETILRLRELRAMKIDMTGLGLGLYEYTHEKFGGRVHGVNFASSVPITARLRQEGGRAETVRVTEALATGLLQVFEDRAIHIPIDSDLRDDLRKPERFVSPAGRVSIAATRDSAGHADHFWSMALAIDAAQMPTTQKLEWYAWTPKAYQRVARW